MCVWGGGDSELVSRQKDAGGKDGGSGGGIKKEERITSWKLRYGGKTRMEEVWREERVEATNGRRRGPSQCERRQAGREG